MTKKTIPLLFVVGLLTAPAHAESIAAPGAAAAEPAASATRVAAPAQARRCRSIGSGLAAYISDENAACLGYSRYRGELAAVARDRDDACRNARAHLASELFSRGFDGECRCTSAPDTVFGGVKWTCRIGYFYMAARPKRSSDAPVGNGNAVR